VVNGTTPAAAERQVVLTLTPGERALLEDELREWLHHRRMAEAAERRLLRAVARRAGRADVVLDVATGEVCVRPVEGG
jgi:hypothetical protein